MFTHMSIWDTLKADGKTSCSLGLGPTYTFTDVDFVSPKGGADGHPHLWVTTKRHVTLVIDIEQPERNDETAEVS